MLVDHQTRDETLAAFDPGPLLEELVRFAAALPPPAESEALTALGDALQYTGRVPAARAANGMASTPPLAARTAIKERRLMVM
jgi:hypothetical protein